jgi:putative transposase
LKDLYVLTGIRKQSLWKNRNKIEKEEKVIKSVVDQLSSIRKTHKAMGCRKMFYKDENQWPVGRDKVIEIANANGFKIRKKRSVVRTTWSQSVEVYPNLIEGMQVNGPNQIWQSDIFYFKVGQTNYYGVTIEDVYTRILKALHMSRSLAARQTVIALQKAIKSTLYKENIKGCIFHTDRGSQFISKEFKELIKQSKMKPSMCLNPQENAYVERVQGTIKK